MFGARVMAGFDRHLEDADGAELGSNCDRWNGKDRARGAVAWCCSVTPVPTGSPAIRLPDVIEALDVITHACQQRLSLLRR
jgi:hypothetical protein